MSNTQALVELIRDPYRRRVFCVKQQSKLDRSLESYVRVYYTHWKSDGDERDREAANKKVEAILLRQRNIIKASTELIQDDENWAKLDVLTVCLANKLLPGDETDLVDLVLNNDLARSHFDATRLKCEKQLEGYAKQLPVFPWVKAERGLGALGLAIIVGEAGNLSDYPNEYALWKRMGVAVIDGRRQGNPDLTGLSREERAKEWIRQKYKPMRRSRLYTVGASLIKHQVKRVCDKNGKDTGERRAVGTYGAIYLDRKKLERERFPDASKMFIHRRAQRYMEKRLLRHLFHRWIAAERELNSVAEAAE
jgi:hypothetical protein